MNTKQKTLGFGMIFQNKEVDIADRCLKSIAGHVDNIYLTVADAEEPSEEAKRLADKYGAKLSYFKWCKDFSAARNFNMSQCKDDWYVWADSDDEVVGMEKARDFVNSLAANIRYVIAPYQYSFATGKANTIHDKERFIRNDGTHVWKGRLHETCVADFKTDGNKVTDIVWRHLSDEARSLESCHRNIEIVSQELAEQLEADPTKPDPRTVYNLAMAQMGLAQNTQNPEDLEEALRAFLKYLELGEWDEHAFMAEIMVSRCFNGLDQPVNAIEALFEALRMRPNYGLVHTELGSTYERLGEDTKAEFWYKTGLVVGEQNSYSDEVISRKVISLMGLASINGRRGKVDDALILAQEALSLSKDNDYVKAFIGHVLDVIDNRKRAEKNLAKLKKDKNPQKVYAKLDAAERSHPIVASWRREQNWKEKSAGNEVAIYTGISWEDWNPDSAKSGIGGSEEAVINMAKQLKSLGWDVTVYGTHGLYSKEYDGIWYKPHWEFAPNEPIDVFISWRDPGVFDFTTNAKKSYLWLHDTNPASSLLPERMAKIDKVMVLSDYHRSLYPDVPDEKIMLTGNGINPEEFMIEVERNPKHVFYGSAPNRGLKTLLEMWPKIKEREPEAVLHWCYGWETFDIAHKHNPLMQRYKKQVLELLQQEGVIDHGRVSHEEVAKIARSCGVWAYPTTFTEIYCITAVKAQAAGCWPVTTTVAALDQMVQFGTKLNVDDIDRNEEAQNQFIDAVVESINKKDDRNQMEAWARSSKSWRSTAEQWSKEFKA